MHQPASHRHHPQPATVPEQTPIQPVYATEFRGQAEVFPQFVEGLQDIEGYSHIYLLYACIVQVQCACGCGRFCRMWSGASLPRGRLAGSTASA